MVQPLSNKNQTKAFPPQKFQLQNSPKTSPTKDHFQEALTSSGSIFFWYDYFSVPQFEVNCPGFATNPNEEQAKAIASIPGFLLEKIRVFYWGQLNFFKCSIPNFGEMIQFEGCFFSDGLVHHQLDKFSDFFLRVCVCV